ncbi:MAG: hypothetical protein ACYC21_05760 [Eubacteriales bacterium]
MLKKWQRTYNNVFSVAVRQKIPVRLPAAVPESDFDMDSPI